MVTTKTLLTSTEYLCHKSHVCSVCRTHNHVSSSLVTYHMVCDKSNMTGATSGTGTVYLLNYQSTTPVFTVYLLNDQSTTPVFTEYLLNDQSTTPVFSGFQFAQYVVSFIMFFGSLFVILSFFF
jgi:hypothetical protein